MSTVRVSTYCAHNGRCSITTEGCTMMKEYDINNIRCTAGNPPREYLVGKDGRLTLDPRPTVTITWSNGYKESGIAGFVAAFDTIENWFDDPRSNPCNYWTYATGFGITINQVQTRLMDAPAHMYYVNDKFLCTVHISERF